MKKLFLTFIAALCCTVMAKAEIKTVSYLYPVYNTEGVPASGIKEWKTASVDATVVESASEQVTWTAGWYVVTGTDVTLAQGAICADSVSLILADGAKLTATGVPGIQVSGTNNSLTIYGQANQAGQLIANGGYDATGIGGGEGTDGYNITINGGIVTANGHKLGVGIGGGSRPNIIINGGVVTANGGFDGAGIGSGSKGSITINGGYVTATSAGYGAGIGGCNEENGSNITINDGVVTATSVGYGAGIGGGAQGSGTYITINGGYVMANSQFADGIGSGNTGPKPFNIYVATDLTMKYVVPDQPEYTTRTITSPGQGGDLYNEFSGKQYVIIGDLPASETTEVTYIDAVGEEQIADAIAVTSSNVPVLWGTGGTTTWYVVTGTDVQIPLGASCRGDVRLILADDAKLTATGIDVHKKPGIWVSGKFNSLTIYGQANQTGQLIATGGNSAAGIGGGEKETGDNITINGGVVTATGGAYGAGIGGGGGESDKLAHGSNITINGGIVTATSGIYAAGIGGGHYGNGSNITINGGTVTASGGTNYSAIGGDIYGSATNIKVATTLGVKADNNNPPTTEIDNDGGDLADKLKNKQFATIVPLQPFKDVAIADIDAAIEGITNETIKAIATTAKTDIQAATSEKAINTIREKALADLQYALTIYNDGKADGNASAFGILGTKQDGPALIVTDKDGKEIILYSPKSVEYIKVKE